MAGSAVPILLGAAAADAAAHLGAVTRAGDAAVVAVVAAGLGDGTEDGSANVIFPFLLLGKGSSLWIVALMVLDPADHLIIVQ